jgi:hypothetical protein
MFIRIGYDIALRFPVPTTVIHLLHVHPARQPQQRGNANRRWMATVFLRLEVLEQWRIDKAKFSDQTMDDATMDFHTTRNSRAAYEWLKRGHFKDP